MIYDPGIHIVVQLYNYWRYVEFNLNGWVNPGVLAEVPNDPVVFRLIFGGCVLEGFSRRP